MADDKASRNDQADDAERRQRERELAAELERGDEPEPPVDAAALGEFEADLDSVSFPATGSGVVAAVGDREIESAEGTYAVEELVPDTDAEAFDAPSAVRARVQRPTVAAAMKRIQEAAGSLQDDDLRGSRWDAYERTLRELAAIEADDEDEGIRVLTDWILERIREQGTLPGSRALRRRAAKFCRANGHEVRDDEWLGV